jgi:hypothetical protein
MQGLKASPTTAAYTESIGNTDPSIKAAGQTGALGREGGERQGPGLGLDGLEEGGGERGLIHGLKAGCALAGAQRLTLPSPVNIVSSTKLEPVWRVGEKRSW